MRLLVSAATAALIAGPSAAQAPDTATPPMPPRPLRDSPPAQPPARALPVTLTDLEAACRRGDRPACEEADRIRGKILSGMSSNPVPAAGGSGPEGAR